MALDRFIASVRREVAKRFDLESDAEIDAFFIGMEESAKDNQEALEKRDKMLRDAVAELCEAKRLLKAAVEDFSFVSENFISNMDSFCSMYNHIAGCVEGCPMSSSDNYGRCKWRLADEALKLLGENGETNG